MTAARNVVTWQPFLTDHMAHTLGALVSCLSVRQTHVVAQIGDARRAEQGWRCVVDGVVAMPRHGWLRFAYGLLRSEREAIHIFCGPFGSRKIMLVFFVALMLGRRVCLISEPYMERQLGYLDDRSRWLSWAKAVLRPLVYRLYGALFGRRITLVLAISPVAVMQFLHLGIPAWKIAPFGYFIPDTGHRHARDTVRCESAALRLIFVGSYIERKGVTPLLVAVRQLRSQGIAVELDLYGPGAPSTKSEDGIRHCGLIPFGEAQQVIAGYDMLVLPSLHDGWGVVVNEALLAGVPVACSSHVGAGAMVSHWGCGIVFDSADEVCIARCIERVASGPELLGSMTAAAELIRPKLSPSVAAGYIAEALDAVAWQQPLPRCPWYS